MLLVSETSLYCLQYSYWCLQVESFSEYHSYTDAVVALIQHEEETTTRFIVSDEDKNFKDISKQLSLL